MRLSRLEQQVLRFIRKQYPIAYDPSTANEIIAIGERPLLTEDAIRQQFKTETTTSVSQSIRTLIGYQCIVKVYLHAPEDYAEQWPAPGRRVRHLLLKEPAGHDAYQVTRFGETVVEGFAVERMKRIAFKWLSKMLEEYVPYIIVFLLGILVSSVFGFDIRVLLKP